MTATPTAELERTRTIELDRIDIFQFRAHFGDGMPELIVDEPPPLGSGAGPDAARLLATAVGQCLSASLVLCLQKSRVAVRDLHTAATLTIARNEAGRLRVTGGMVRIQLDSDGDRSKLERCFGMFEDYCIVTATVRRAFPVSVEIVDALGRAIHRSEG